MSVSCVTEGQFELALWGLGCPTCHFGVVRLFPSVPPDSEETHDVVLWNSSPARPSQECHCWHDAAAAPRFSPTNGPPRDQSLPRARDVLSSPKHSFSTTSTFLIVLEWCSIPGADIVHGSWITPVPRCSNDHVQPYLGRRSHGPPQPVATTESCIPRFWKSDHTLDVSIIYGRSFAATHGRRENVSIHRLR